MFKDKRSLYKEEEPTKRKTSHLSILRRNNERIKSHINRYNHLRLLIVYYWLRITESQSSNGERKCKSHFIPLPPLQWGIWGPKAEVASGRFKLWIQIPNHPRMKHTILLLHLMGPRVLPSNPYATLMELTQNVGETEAFPISCIVSPL